MYTKIAKNEVVVLCAVCTGGIVQGEFDDFLVADRPQYDYEGALDCIELAHYHCARLENKRVGENVWEMGAVA